MREFRKKTSKIRLQPTLWVLIDNQIWKINNGLLPDACLFYHFGKSDAKAQGRLGIQD